MTRDEIAAIMAALGDLVQVIRDADPADKAELYAQIRLPAALADEAADGLVKTYEDHLTSGAGEQEAARAALVGFGNLAVVVGE